MEKRLLSLDVLRGFDMMFIMGGASIITCLCSLFPGGESCWLASQMHHVAWNGLHMMDMVFPLFLFIAGISFPFSYGKQLASGSTRGRIYMKVVRRAVILFLLGLVYNGIFSVGPAHVRIFSVLARIGFAWMLAAILFMNTRPVTRIAVSASILIVYYLLIRLLNAPDCPGVDPFSLEDNIVGYIDRTIFPHHLYKENFDPEGLLSLLPAIVTASLGMLTGEFVKIPESRLSGNRKSLVMLGGALALVVIGLIWSIVFPINKKLWSSSFVLVVGGISLALFALFFYIIDVKGWKRGTRFFEVIGLNSITIYMAQCIVPFSAVSGFFLGGVAGLCHEPWADLILSIGYFTVCWLFLHFLYRKRTFLKV